MGRRCERDSDSATEYCGAKSQIAAADSDVPDRLLRGAPPDGDTRCQSWRAPNSNRQSFNWYSSSTKMPFDRVLLGGRNASSPSALKSLYAFCRPITPRHPAMGLCCSSTRMS